MSAWTGPDPSSDQGPEGAQHGTDIASFQAKRVRPAGLSSMKMLRTLLDSLLFVGFSVLLLALTILSASELNLAPG